MSERIFPAKLLLFGEHILLKGAQALAVPTPGFFGRWSKEETPLALPNRALFADALHRFRRDLPLDFRAMERDLEAGWYFHANIPQGYGMGSSGAFCAAVFAKYGGSYFELSLAQLKQQLAEMEACFHGRSSGIDPLTSFLHRPLLVSGDQVSDLTGHYHPPASVTVFLIDTVQPRQTGQLVNWFINRCEAPDFQHLLHHDLFPRHAAMLDAWIKGEAEIFMEKLVWISAWQRMHLTPMAPASEIVQQWWHQSLREDDTRLKICGAGGGGFVLGFTFDRRKVEAIALDLGLRIIFPFDTHTDAQV